VSVPDDATARLLAGITVVELGDGIAGSVTAALCASFGASVTKLVAADRPVLAHLPRLAGDGSLAARVLDRDKTLVVGDVATHGPRIAAATIVVDDRGDGVHDPAALIAEVAATNRAVWVTISPFGLSGPRARRRGGELVALASGGLLHTVSSERTGEPVSPPGFLASRAVGLVAALAALHGLDRHRAGGQPVHVDVSAQEAVIMTGALPECAHVLYRCPGQAGSGRYVAPSGVFPCVDGSVRIAAIENHQWDAMVRVLGAPGWTAGLEDRPARAEHAAFITERVAEWSRTQTKAECADRLQRAGVPSTPVNGPDELLASPQLAARRFIVDTELDGIPVRVPGSPWVLELDGPEPASEPRDLGSLRLLEITHVLAAPIAGALLGAIGADVVRLEDTSRLDLYRRTGPFADGIAGFERGAYFAVANHSKRSIVVGPDEAAPVAAALAQRSHAVLENVGQRRMGKLGIDASALAVLAPGALRASVSGFGNAGPLSGYRAYANNVQAYGGLAYLTRDRDGAPARVGTVIADTLSSVLTATVIAAWWLGPCGGTGGTLDVAMAEVVATTVAEYVAEASVGAARTIPSADHSPFAPHGVYRSDDGRWIALSVQSDAEWEALLDALDRPAALADPAWTGADRCAARAAIDAALAPVLGGSDAAALLAALDAHRVRAAAVLGGHDLVTDHHLATRGFFPEIDHPDPELGRERLVGLGWRFVGDAPLALRPPPALGSTRTTWEEP